MIKHSLVFLALLITGCGGAVAPIVEETAASDAGDPKAIVECSPWGGACTTSSDCCEARGYGDAGLPPVCYEGRCAFGCDATPSQIACADIRPTGTSTCDASDAGAMVCHAAR